MTEITLKAKVSKDHKLSAMVPPEVPAGDVEVVVRIADTQEQRDANADALLKVFDEISAKKGQGRTKEDIDAQIAEERASWGE